MPKQGPQVRINVWGANFRDMRTIYPIELHQYKHRLLFLYLIETTGYKLQWHLAHQYCAKFSIFFPVNDYFCDSHKKTSSESSPDEANRYDKTVLLT